MEPKIMKNNTLSRRTLLRLGLAGAIGALLPGRSAWARSVAPTHAPILRLADEEQGIGYGLVLAGGVVLRAEPNVKAKRVRTLKRDEVLALLERVDRSRTTTPWPTPSNPFGRKGCAWLSTTSARASPRCATSC